MSQAPKVVQLRNVRRNPLERRLDIGLRETFPASDPVAIVEPAPERPGDIYPRPRVMPKARHDKDARASSTEIELKLAAPPADLEKLKDALLAMAPARTEVRSLVSTYYDTPSLALRRAHLTLRVRRQGRKFVQTVKADNSDLLSRGEWEDSIKKNRPEAKAPNSGKRLPRAARKKGLRALFTTTVTRTVIEIEPRPDTRIEAAVDTGEIRSAHGGAAEPISEVELELKRGDPAVLYEVALQLLDVAPIRVDTRSKSERGYRLAGLAGSPKAVRTIPLALDPGMTAEAALECIGRRCLSQLLRNEPVVLAGEPEGVHQMRVAVRRLRAALSAFKPMLPAEHYRWLTDELKALAERFGPARNWEVFVSELLHPVGDALPGKNELDYLLAAAEQRRLTTMEEAAQAVLSQSHVESTLRISRWFAARGWRDQPISKRGARLLAPMEDVAPKLLNRVHRKARRRSKRFAKLTARQRHKLRIALKNVRYMLDLLSSLFRNKDVRKAVKKLKALQDCLGSANDVRTAHGLIDELHAGSDRDSLAIARAGGMVLGWHERALAGAQPVTARRVHRFRRMDRFWQ